MIATVATLGCRNAHHGSVVTLDQAVVPAAKRPAPLTRATESPRTPSPPPLAAIPSTAFCPTSGRVAVLGERLMKVNAGGMRGVVGGDASRTAELAFTYRGPSSASSPLADGTLRRQIGLRLRAQDTCNAIYVMWQVAPTPRVAVSVKWNPGKSKHAECKDDGYINLRPTPGLPPPAPVVAGVRRTLRAELVGTTLRVFADSAVAWEGTLPAESTRFDGPAGLRSDNGEFDFEVRVPGGVSRASCAGVIRD